MSGIIRRRRSSALKAAPIGRSLDTLPEDVLVRVIDYFSVEERVAYSRISRKFDECINSVWRREEKFPFLDRFKRDPKDSSMLKNPSMLKKYLQLLLKATNVRSIDFFIPNIYPSDDEWFPRFGKALSGVNKSVEEVELCLENDFGLMILVSYLDSVGSDNRLRSLNISRTDDLNQVLRLFQLLSHHALDLEHLAFDYPDDDSHRLDPYLTLVGPRLVSLECTQYMRFNLGSRLLSLNTLEKELEEEEVRVLSENCPYLSRIKGVIGGSEENYHSLKKLKLLRDVSLADFHFDDDLERLKDFILSAGPTLFNLSLHNLIRFKKTGLWSVIVNSCPNLQSLQLYACLLVDDSGTGDGFLDSLEEATQNLHITIVGCWISGLSEDDITKFVSSRSSVTFTVENYSPDADFGV